MEQKQKNESEFSKDMFEPVGPIDEQEINSNHSESISYWSDVFRRFRKNKVGVVCLIVIILLILGSALGPAISGTSISEQDLFHTNASFGSEGHLFGTDNLGRDMFARLWYGTRISLTIAFFAILIGLFIGVIYGGIAGYFGGKVDNIMMRIVDIVISIPYLIVVILLMLVLKPGIRTMIIAYAAVGWTEMARLVRGQIIKLKESEYVLASRILGGAPIYILFHDLIPNTISIIIVELTLSIPSAIFTESFLSYIGIGVQIPLASLGTLASDGIKSFQLYPHLLLLPAGMLCMIMLAFNLLGDSLRDAMDPKLRR